MQCPVMQTTTTTMPSINIYCVLTMVTLSCKSRDLHLNWFGHLMAWVQFGKAPDFSEFLSRYIENNLIVYTCTLYRASEINVLIYFIWKLSCMGIRLYRHHPSMAKTHTLPKEQENGEVPQIYTRWCQDVGFLITDVEHQEPFGR